MAAKKIIVGYDGSADARVAADWALDEAVRTGAPVTFVYAFEWPSYAPAAAMVPAPAVWPGGEADRALHGMMNELVASAAKTHPGVAAHGVIVHAAAAQTLRDNSAGAAMVVLGSRGHHSAVGQLGSVSTAVSAHAHCPVVVVRGTTGTLHDPVVVGVDGSDCALIALTVAFEQAAARGVALRVVRAWTPPTASWIGPPIDAEEINLAERQALGDIVAAWRDKFPTVAVSYDVIADHPTRALAEASTTAQLVVVGSRGRGALRGALLGSVSQHLLRHSVCTVAVVRELAEA